MIIEFTYADSKVTIQEGDVLCTNTVIKDLVTELLESHPEGPQLGDPGIRTAEMLKGWGVIDSYEIMETTEEEDKIY